MKNHKEAPAEKKQRARKIARTLGKTYPEARTARDTVLLEFLENLNDALVRELYNPDELHDRDLYFARLVSDARLPSATTIDGAKQLAEIRNILERASNINSPLRAALFDLGSLKITAETAAAV